MAFRRTPWGQGVLEKSDTAITTYTSRVTSNSLSAAQQSNAPDKEPRPDAEVKDGRALHYQNNMENQCGALRTLHLQC
jgi:hypothetical protein